MGKVVRIEDYRRRREQERGFNPWGLLLFTPLAFWALVAWELSK